MSDQQNNDAPPTFLRDMVRERPKDFDFADILTGEEFVPDEDGASFFSGDAPVWQSLEAIAGDYIALKPGGADSLPVYGKSPKMRQQKFLLGSMAEMEKETDPALELDLLATTAAKVLYTPDGENFRPMTADEVMDTLDMQEAIIMLYRLLGLSRSNAGPNPANPTG